MAEKLDYEAGRFSVQRHVRGKWACTRRQTLVQAPVLACVIEKGHDHRRRDGARRNGQVPHHQPLYRQEVSLGHAAFAVPRSTQAEWLGALGVKLAPLVQAMGERHVLKADETPVAMLKPGMAEAQSLPVELPHQGLGRCQRRGFRLRRKPRRAQRTALPWHPKTAAAAGEVR